MNEQWNIPSQKPISADKEANQWAMFIHFALFAGYLAPLIGLILPMILWQIKKDQYPFVNVHGKIVANWIISLLIYGAICAVLFLVAVGIIGFILLGLLSCIFPIIGGIKANQGEVWEYPLSLKFIR